MRFSGEPVKQNLIGSYALPESRIGISRQDLPLFDEEFPVRKPKVSIKKGRLLSDEWRVMRVRGFSNISGERRKRRSPEEKPF
jgi:hypothetical protein